VTKTVIAIRGVPPMPLSWQKLYGSLATALIAMALVTGAAAQGPIAIDSRFADVNGTRLHYLVAGKGRPDPSFTWLRPEQSHVAASHG
jgi:hypothetical protein